MRQRERHSDLRQLLMHPIPIRLRMDTLTLAARGEQAEIHLHVVTLGDRVIIGASPICDVDDRDHRVPRYALRLDLLCRQPSAR